MQVDWLRLVNPDFRADVSGTFPINLAFAPVHPRVLALPFNGHLEATGTTLDRLVRFWPQTVESIHGPFSVSAKVSGTPQIPRFSGEASLRSGKIKALEIANPLEDVEVDLSLRQDTVLVTRATGAVRAKGKTGRVEASGSLRLDSYDRFDFDLRLTGRDVPARF